MINPAVNIEICLAFLRKWLEGFRNYPRSEAGERRFAQCLQLNAVSVEHLEAILQSFQDEFPTVREIHDVAWNSRAKFEPAEDTVAEWARIYGKPQAFEKHPPDELAMHWQAIRDMLFYSEGPGVYELLKIVNVKPEWARANSQRFWSDARVTGFRDHRDTVDFVRVQIAEMGWDTIMKLTSSPVPFPYTGVNHRKRRDELAPVGAPITQADIDRAKQSQKSTAQVDADLDAWSDPDR